jgi:integrase
VGPFFDKGTNKGTKTEEDNDFGMKPGKIKDQLPYKLAVLRDRGGDLSKWWYVEFYAYDETVGDLVRKRKKISMDFQDKKSRTNEGNRLVAIANDQLKKGYHFKKVEPEDQTKKTEQSDDLLLVLNYIVKILSTSLAPKTIITYQSAVNKLEIYGHKNRPLISMFTPSHAVNFRDFLTTTVGNSPRTANNTLQHLCALYSHYQERTSVKENPFKVRSLKEPVTSKNHAFTDEDRKTIEQYMLKNEPELYLITRFIYLAFIRPGELLQIKISEISLSGNYITISGAVSKSGKNETAQIIMPLRKEIIERVDFSRPEKRIFGVGMRPGYAVCAKQVPFRRHQKVLKACGLELKGYTLYSWKHTGAVNAYRAGVGIKELQSMLRHSSVQITDIYLKSLGLRTDPNLQNYSW